MITMSTEDNSNTRRIIGPFNRVEGDLEVTLDIRDGQVDAAWVNSPLFRGFEQILHGKDPRDAMVITPRICGICSVAQSVAAAQALAAAQGLHPTPNGRIATNLVLACENLADHLSHFYLFFMPDFARDQYSGQRWHHAIAERFRAQTGSASRDALPARAQFLHLTGILAGKWPHSLSLQPGGTSRAIEPQERVRLLSTLASFRHFLEQTLFGDRLEAVTAIDSADALRHWAEAHPHSDFGAFLQIAEDLQLQRLGHATDRFMSYGAYGLDGSGTSHLFERGVWDGRLTALDPATITEDISHSWMQAQNGPRHPYQGTTLPQTDASTDHDQGYSWCKAPRLDGAVVEVGALARQVVQGHPLLRELVASEGGNVRSRVVARLLELALVVPEMERWVRALRPGEPFCNQAGVPDQAEGAGLIEAARGSLGHWLRIKNGRILNYQIIAPTTWNFSPRDADGQPGALEQALLGTVVSSDGKQDAAIQHVVRSFDPCMVCTVH